MSVDLLVYLERERMPSPSDWQAAIARANFPLVLDQDFDPFKFSGFLPCAYGETSSGFEYYAGPVNEVLDGRTYNFSVTLAVRTGAKEMQAAFAAASSLCFSSGGVLVDPQSGEEISASAVIDWSRSMIQVCDAEGL